MMAINHGLVFLDSSRTMKRLDGFGVLEFCDFYDEGTLKEKFPMVKPEVAEEAMVAFTGDPWIFKCF